MEQLANIPNMLTDKKFNLAAKMKLPSSIMDIGTE